VQRYAYDAPLDMVTFHAQRNFGKNLVDVGTPIDRVASGPQQDSDFPVVPSAAPDAVTDHIRRQGSVCFAAVD
jgi:hypothetical protein